MKKNALIISLFTMVTIFSSALLAEAQNNEPKWNEVLQVMLEKGKQVAAPTDATQPAGLAYTASEEVVLKEAFAEAFKEEKNNRACECLKTAVDLDYNPYIVLKTIYSTGGKLEIDQLCLCATEIGVMKAIIAKAATDAGYSFDEISQAQCLQSAGLAYSKADTPVDPIPIDPDPKPPVSNSVP